ncbi:MAG: LamG-like jellyroll fold domain-containing protein [Streptosporangiaceae bacterium]|jgi:concanavalin A-like lectin/glucanase superfamily protein
MKAKILLGLTALVVAAATATSMQVPGASAATGNAGRTQLEPGSPNISAQASPSWQTNNTVWAIAQAKGVVYVGGQFTSVRPPGDPRGTGEVARSYLAAFSATTGALITSFHPAISGTTPGVYALTVSPDGKTLYAGGLFSHVGQAYRDNLAAFSTSTGALISTWAPTAAGKVNTIAPSPAGSEIYIGGAFNGLDQVSRTYAGAVTASGTLLPWAPVLNDAVTSIAVTPDDSQVLVGGYFQTINGVTQNAAGGVDPVTGTTTERWGANIVPWNPPSCISSVKDIVISGSTAYIAAEGTGGGCFDGDFAVRLSATGDQLAWQNACLGATQALVVINGWLYKGSHAHDCAYAPGGFPQADNSAGEEIAHHLLDQSPANGTLGHWTPNTNATLLGPRVMATDGSRLFLGGDFTTVNDVPQQGFAIFGPGPDLAKPGPPPAPTVTSTSAGVASVTFSAVSTPDVGTLSYEIYRSGRGAPVATVTATSWPWALPVLHYREAGLRPGSTYTFRVRVSDGTRVSAKSLASAPVTIASKSPAHSYQWTVLHGKPSFYWLLDQRSGRVAADSTSHHFNGVYEPGTTQGVAGPVPGSGQTATAFNGATGLVYSAAGVTSPATFSIEAWFRTSTDTGGKIIGFGNRRTAESSQYDRQLYMMNDGQLVFGVQANSLETIETPHVYNDGQWHYVVATFNSAAGSDNMALYIDGHLIGTRAAGPARSYAGYWRVGGDDLAGWNLDPWKQNSQGTTEPISYYFGGSIGDVAVYPYALSAAQVAAHYAANALSH